MPGRLEGKVAVITGAGQAVARMVVEDGLDPDVVARFGGDEFSVILPDTGREGSVSGGQVAAIVANLNRLWSEAAADRAERPAQPATWQ